MTPLDGPEALLDGLDVGVRLAVDDFGTGYSNLTRLRDLPVSTVKLDASMAIPQQPLVQGRHEEFLAAVVGLGCTLGMTVTAEGIETSDQAQRITPPAVTLARAGCSASPCRRI